MTLGDLRTKVTAYVNRDDPEFLDNLDHFIHAGHRWLERKFHGREALYGHWATSDSVGVGVGTVPLPACYRASAELRVYRLPDRIPLARIHPRDLRDPFTNADGIDIDLRTPGTLGTPSYFAVLGRSLAIRPLPSEALDLEIVGTGWAEPMHAPLDETVLTQDAPDAVIYAAARETWLFFGDDAQVTYWEAQAGKAVDEWISDRVHEESPGPMVMEVPG
jgi:hypothetical protein